VLTPCPSLVSNKIIHRTKREWRVAWTKKTPKLKIPYKHLGNINYFVFQTLK
jgi:hypothetical protein